jgi:hypothetical protein
MASRQRFRIHIRPTSLALLAVGIMAAAMQADLALAKTAERAAATVAGKPNWNGVWVLANTFMDKAPANFTGTDGGTAVKNEQQFSQPKLVGDYLAKFQALEAQEAAGKRLNDTGAECLPQGMPRFWHGPYAFEISQTPVQVNIFQEWNEQTRRVYLDGRGHNPDADDTFNGHSIGHWEGRELVIDTAQIRADSGMGAGAMHSDQIHITERIRQLGPDLIKVRMTVTDPKALAEPWVSDYTLKRKPKMEIQEYVCAENNRNVVDDHGVAQIVK